MPAKNKTDKCGQFYPNFKPPKKHGMKLKPTTRTKLYRSFPALWVTVEKFSAHFLRPDETHLSIWFIISDNGHDKQ